MESYGIIQNLLESFRIVWSAWDLSIWTPMESFRIWEPKLISKLETMQTKCKYSSTQTVAMKPKAKEIYVLQTKKRYIHANVHLYSENERETTLIHTVVVF